MRELTDWITATKLGSGHEMLRQIQVPQCCICFLKTQSFSLHKMLTDGLESCGLLVDNCDVFISSHSDGTHPLQRIHWWASDVMPNFSKSVLINKQTHLHLGWPAGRVLLSKFSFWANYCFNFISVFSPLIASLFILQNRHPTLMSSQCLVWCPNHCLLIMFWTFSPKKLIGSTCC